MSLDGFIADLNDGVDELFGWYEHGDVAVETANPELILKESEEEAARLRDVPSSVGALISGRRLFDVTNGWNGRHPLDVPVVVVTHHVPEGWPREDAPFTFVTEGGVEGAVAQAKAIAGEKAVAVASAQMTQQCLDAGLLDELHVDLIPVLLGEGIPFFANLKRAPVRLDDPEVSVGKEVTHLRYRVKKR
jgi:dihydrofolate reductase